MHCSSGLGPSTMCSQGCSDNCTGLIKLPEWPHLTALQRPDKNHTAWPRALKGKGKGGKRTFRKCILLSPVWVAEQHLQGLAEGGTAQFEQREPNRSGEQADGHGQPHDLMATQAVLLPCALIPCPYIALSAHPGTPMHLRPGNTKLGTPMMQVMPFSVSLPWTPDNCINASKAVSVQLTIIPQSTPHSKNKRPLVIWLLPPTSILQDYLSWLCNLKTPPRCPLAIQPGIMLQKHLAGCNPALKRWPRLPFSGEKESLSIDISCEASPYDDRELAHFICPAGSLHKAQRRYPLVLLSKHKPLYLGTRICSCR